MKRKKTKLITLALLTLIIPLSLFATTTTYNYFSYSYTRESSYDLEKIYIEDAYTSEYNTNGDDPGYFFGYYMGQVVFDFNEGSSSSSYTNSKKILRSDNHGSYGTNYNSYNYPSYIIDQSGNKSSITIYAEITKKSSTGTIKSQKWYELSAMWYNTFTGYPETYTDSYTIDYYFVIDNYEILDYNEDLTLILPSYSRTNLTPRFILYNNWSSVKYIDDPILTNSSSFNVGQIDESSFIDAYTLDIEFEKLFNDSTTDFFDGDKHDYYSLTINSYLYNQAVDKDFDVALQVSSDHNFQLYLDDDDNASSDEKISYDLYLKYMGSSTGAYSYAPVSNNEIFLITNINTYSAAKTLYLTTQSDNAIATYNTKGTYQDTVYLNFITEGWQNSASFYDTLIDLN